MWWMGVGMGVRVSWDCTGRCYGYLQERDQVSFRIYTLVVTIVHSL